MSLREQCLGRQRRSLKTPPELRSRGSISAKKRSLEVLGGPCGGAKGGQGRGEVASTKTRLGLNGQCPRLSRGFLSSTRAAATRPSRVSGREQVPLSWLPFQGSRATHVVRAVAWGATVQVPPAGGLEQARRAGACCGEAASPSSAPLNLHPYLQPGLQPWKAVGKA